MKINPTTLTKEQKQLLCLCINKKGTGEHPCAEVNNLQYFAVDYAVECLAKSEGFLNPAGAAIAEQIHNIFIDNALDEAPAETLIEFCTDLMAGDNNYGE